MLGLAKRRFKKPLENKAYDTKVTNFNTDLIEIEINKLVSKEDDAKDITVTFTEATEDAEFKSNNKLSILFGLIKKKFSLLLDTLNKKADLVDGKVKYNQLPEVDYAPTNYSHTTVNGHTVESNVPSSAKFTYTHPASMVTGLHTSLQASDVPIWAKQSTKPSYAATEVGATPNSHIHTIANVNNLQSTLDSKAVAVIPIFAPVEHYLLMCYIVYILKGV